MFFDSIGLKWQYEPEGFDLGGAWYLPDFWIEDWQAFVEIKPTKMNEQEFRKCLKLCVGKGNDVISIQGNPWPGEYFITVFYGDVFYKSEQSFDEFGATSILGSFYECSKCSSLLIDDESHFLHSELEDAIYCDENGCAFRNLKTSGKRLSLAFSSARSHRFDERSEK